MLTHFFSKYNFFCVLTLLLFLASVINYNFNTALRSSFILYKTPSTDPTLGNIFFYWLDLLYLPLLYLFLLLAFLYIAFPARRADGIYLFWAILFLQSLGLSSFYTLNSSLLFSDFSLMAANSFLTNTLNKYHPLIFYLAVVFTSSLLFFTTFSQTLFKKFSLVYNIYYYYYFRILIFFFSSVTLLFGSWWALQEWTWGGWWNWDPSETFGLGPTLLILSFTHSNTTVLTFPTYYKRQIWILLFFFFSYLLVQLNFEILSHNFGLNFFYFFNNNLGPFSLLILLVFFLVNLCKEIYFYKNLFQARSSKVIILQTVFVSIFYFFTSVILAFSFFTLFMHFLWKFFTINLGVTIVLHPVFFTFFFVTLCIVVFSLSTKNFLVTSFILPFQSTPLLLGFYYFSHKKLFSVHLVLSWNILNALTSFGEDFLQWDSTTHPKYFCTENLFLRRNIPLRVTDGGMYTEITYWKDFCSNYTTAHQINLNYEGGFIEQSLFYSAHKNLANCHSPLQSRYLVNLETKTHQILPLVTLLIIFWACLGNLWIKGSPYTRTYYLI